jgi:HD-GYP domain-containing protein (c-di-GMP phosphodiesterase class II)
VHDIGRLALSDAALGRAGPLNDDERTALHEHPLRGEQIVEGLGFLDRARPLIRHHHERWDGQGYPDGLRGREIDPLTRVLAVADAFDAMTSPRPHRPAMSREEALAEMASNAKTQFDPGLVEPFGRAVVALA